MAMKLTSVTYPNLFIAGPHHIPVIVCPLVNLSVNYGEYHHVASRVLNAFARVGTLWICLLLSISDDIDEGYRWSRIATSVSEN
eukprot:scaffold4705_cov193-Alexandrium_tamarense.AAC.2